MNPYKNKGNIRTFSKDVNKLELVWHQDAEDRDIEILEGKGWELQMDNELPQELLPHHMYYIEAKRHHRLIKGSGNLVIEIKEE